MRRYLFFSTLLLALAVWPLVAGAQSWEARQGDLLRLVLPAPSGRHVRLTALGKTWPWRRLRDGRLLAWIGVDMDVKPGTYTLLVRAGVRHRRHTLIVHKTAFRISRIHVARRLAQFDARALARIRADHALLRRAYAASVRQAAVDFLIARAPVTGIISTPFGARRYVNGEKRSPHSGVDIAAPEGTPIVNTLPGRVLLAAPLFLNGNTVVVGHGRGLVMIYSHLKRIDVHAGERLQAGARIGSVGKTGRATGPHLHWGVRFRGARINPMSLLAPPPKAQGAVVAGAS